MVRSGSLSPCCRGASLMGARELTCPTLPARLPLRPVRPDRLGDPLLKVAPAALLLLALDRELHLGGPRRPNAGPDRRPARRPPPPAGREGGRARRRRRRRRARARPGQPPARQAQGQQAPELVEGGLSGHLPRLGARRLWKGMAMRLDSFGRRADRAHPPAASVAGPAPSRLFSPPSRAPRRRPSRSCSSSSRRSSRTCRSSPRSVRLRACPGPWLAPAARG